MNNLKQIFYSLDKVSDKWTSYFDVYERHLGSFQNTQPHVLEIGVQRGGSVDMWLEYFGQGTTVLGVDIDPACKQLQYPPNVEIAIGDQASAVFWQQTLANRPLFDVIVDDGGHTMTQQIVSLECLWSHLKPGGVYVCEDTHTSYWPNWGGGFDHPRSFQTYAKRLTDLLNRQHIARGMINQRLIEIFGTSLTGVYFYNSQVVLEKGTVQPFERVFSRE